jgi:polysaccharide biosynthesis protein VpsM
MKNWLKFISIPGCALAAGVFSTAMAAPLFSPVDNVDVDVNGAASLAYNSNLLSSAANKIDDYVATLSPGMDIEYGKNSPTNVDFQYTENFYRYLEHPAENEELSNVGLTGEYQMSKLDLTGHFSYNQNYQNTPSAITGAPLTSILRFDTTDAGINADYKLSKWEAQLGFDYTQTNYLYSEGTAFQNLRNYAVPLSLYYLYTDKINFGVSYSYVQSDPENALDNLPGTAGLSRDANTAGFVLRVSDWNKLTGTLNVGIVNNDVEAGNGQPSQSTTTGSYAVNLAYAYSDKWNFSLNGSRNFSPGTAGQNIEATNIGLLATYSLSDTVNLQATVLNYTYSQYLQTAPARDDETYDSGVTVNWHPRDYLTVSLGYAYFMNSSSVPGATYNINTVTLSTSVHY